MHRVWATVKALAPKSKPKRLQLHKDGRMLSPTAELQWIVEEFGKRYGSSFSSPAEFPVREHPPVQVQETQVQALLGELQVRKAVPPGAVPSVVWRICSREVSTCALSDFSTRWVRFS